MSPRPLTGTSDWVTFLPNFDFFFESVGLLTALTLVQVWTVWTSDSVAGLCPFGQRGLWTLESVSFRVFLTSLWYKIVLLYIYPTLFLMLFVTYKRRQWMLEQSTSLWPQRLLCKHKRRVLLPMSRVNCQVPFARRKGQPSKRLFRWVDMFLCRASDRSSRFCKCMGVVTFLCFFFFFFWFVHSLKPVLSDHPTVQGKNVVIGRWSLKQGFPETDRFFEALLNSCERCGTYAFNLHNDNLRQSGASGGLMWWFSRKLALWWLVWQ